MAKKAPTAAPAPESPKPTERRKRKRRARKRKANGRPKYEPTDKHRGSVNALSAAGYSQELIAEYIGVDAKTLRKHFPRELKFATMELLGGAVSGLANALKANEAWAVIFVLKTRGKKLHNGEGWSEWDERFKPPPGAGSDAVPVHLSSLRDDQLFQLLKRLKLAAETAARRANAAAELPLVGSSTG